MNSPLESRPSRRWFQFSLRALFIATLSAAMYFAGWSSAKWHAERQRRQDVEQAIAEAKMARMEAEHQRLMAVQQAEYARALALAAAAMANQPQKHPKSP